MILKSKLVDFFYAFIPTDTKKWILLQNGNFFLQIAISPSYTRLLIAVRTDRLVRDNQKKGCILFPTF